MYCKLCFHEAILISAKKSKVAGAHVRVALDIYSRHIVGDHRLREENEVNEEVAPREARAFVLGAEEAERQLRSSGDAKFKMKLWVGSFRSLAKRIAGMEHAMQAHTRAINDVREMTQKQLRPEASPSPPLPRALVDHLREMQERAVRKAQFEIIPFASVCKHIVAGRPDQHQPRWPPEELGPGGDQRPRAHDARGAERASPRHSLCQWILEEAHSRGWSSVRQERPQELLRLRAEAHYGGHQVALGSSGNRHGRIARALCRSDRARTTTSAAPGPPYVEGLLR